MQLMTTKDVFAAALKLPTDDRRELADRLLTSLQALPANEWEAKWVAEAERRLVEVCSGRKKLIDDGVGFYHNKKGLQPF